jgi:hypothetical protein
VTHRWRHVTRAAALVLLLTAGWAAAGCVAPVDLPVEAERAADCWGRAAGGRLSCDALVESIAGAIGLTPAPMGQILDADGCGPPVGCFEPGAGPGSPGAIPITGATPLGLWDEEPARK